MIDEFIPSRALQVELEDDEEALAFSITLINDEGATWRERRHRLATVQLYKEPGNHPVHLQDKPESTSFRNEEGELDFSLPMRKTQIHSSIPYGCFQKLYWGDLFSLRVGLENRTTGEVLESEHLSLIATKDGKLDLLTDAQLEAYLNSDIPGAEQTTKIWTRMELGAGKKTILTSGVKRLEKLAEHHIPEAAEKLYELFRDGRLVPADEAKAQKWLETYEQLKRLVDMHEDGQNPEDMPDAVTDEATLHKCEQFAKAGYVQAKWLIYSFSRTPAGKSYDRDRAFNLLKSAAADGLEQAVEALAPAYADHEVYLSQENVRDYMSVLIKAAEKRQPLAEFLLYRIYCSGDCLGQSVGKDQKKAFVMLRASAEDGKAEAAYALWQSFEKGNEFLMERSDALQWLTQAAERGLPQAEERIGDLFIDGKYLKKDNEKGVRYLEKAAAHNNWDAQIKQFQSYKQGFYKDILFEKDEEKAFSLLRRFAEAGNPKACLMIADYYENGNAMLMEHREVLGYLRRAADKDYEPAMFRLATVLLDGYYVKRSTGAAKKLLDRAAASGNPDAQFALYQYYRSGYKSLKNKQPNLERAWRWLTKAAASLPEAQYEIWALDRQERQEMGIDESEATDCLFRSAEQRYSPALYQAGLLLADGERIAKNPERGIQLLEDAVRLRNPEAMFTLSKIRRTGTFGGKTVGKNETEAEHLLILSAELGYRPACRRIAELYSEGRLSDESVLWVRTAAERAGINFNMFGSNKAEREAAATKKES